MANFLKAKVAVSFFSISIIVLVALLDSNFNAPVTIKRWGKLTWEDFQGFPRPFSGYGAVIGSQVYLEFDSASSKYIAYAGQNNMVSWTKENTKNSEYALNHEQYHFNITELHARLLNEYIEANPSESESFYTSRLYSIRFDLNSMQDKYDSETDHSLIQDQQRLWEFKIDSLVTLHSKDSIWLNDYYSGARIFFPHSPEFQRGFSETQTPYRFFRLRKYDMVLSLASFQYNTFDVASFEANLREFYSKLSLQVNSFVLDSSLYNFKALVIAKDSLKKTIHNAWIYNGSYVYKLTASYSGETADTLGYLKIANSFLSSFSIHNTDNFWITKFVDSKSSSTVGILTTISVNITDKTKKNCFSYGRPSQNGFYRGPMFRTDGGLLIAYDIIKHADSLLYRNSLIFNDKIYGFRPDSTDQIYFVPGNALSKESYEMKFGYQLTKDSTETCYTLHYQNLIVNPKTQF